MSLLPGVEKNPYIKAGYTYDDLTKALVPCIKANEYKYLQNLVELGADLEWYFEEEDCTPLTLTISVGNFDMFKLLVANLVDIDQPIKGGWTPLHLATKAQKYEFVEVLLEHMVSIDLKNEDGKSALDICKELGNNGIEKLIKEKAEHKHELHLHTFRSEEHEDLWCFYENCKRWPTVFFKETTRPVKGTYCPECLKMQKEGSGRKFKIYKV